MKYEQYLVSKYAIYLESNGAVILNKNCSSNKTFDLKFKRGEMTWCFEAKSHMSKDAYNGVHKLFGELMKDATRIARNGNKKWKLGLLLDARKSDYVKSNGFSFYKRKISEIDQSLLKNFGKNVSVKQVVFFNPKLRKVRWEGTWIEFINELNK